MKEIISTKALKSAAYRLVFPWGVTIAVVVLYYIFAVGSFDSKSFLATLSSTSIAIAGLFTAYYREEKRHSDKTLQDRNFQEIQKVGELVEFIKNSTSQVGVRVEAGMEPLPESGKRE